MRVLVVHPPVSIARDFIDYPYFADLGAVQVAATLRAAGHDVTLVNAYALPGSTLTWREDGRAHLGGSVEQTLAACPEVDVAVVATTPSTGRARATMCSPKSSKGFVNAPSG